MSNVDYWPLLVPADWRIWVTQIPGNTWPKIPWSSVSATTSSLGNVTTGSINPISDNNYNIGSGSRKYNTVYATTINASTIAMWDINITTTSNVIVAVVAQDRYIEIDINWTTYKLLLAA